MLGKFPPWSNPTTLSGEEAAGAPSLTVTSGQWKNMGFLQNLLADYAF